MKYIIYISFSGVCFFPRLSPHRIATRGDGNRQSSHTSLQPVSLIKITFILIENINKLQNIECVRVYVSKCVLIHSEERHFQRKIDLYRCIAIRSPITSKLESDSKRSRWKTISLDVLGVQERLLLAFVSFSLSRFLLLRKYKLGLGDV